MLLEKPAWSFAYMKYVRITKGAKNINTIESCQEKITAKIIPDIIDTDDYITVPTDVFIIELSRAVSVESEATTVGGVCSGSSNHLMLFFIRDSKPIFLTA